jgi:2-methylaconitate cis-trans-isomerase PrpF
MSTPLYSVEVFTADSNHNLIRRRYVLTFATSAEANEAAKNILKVYEGENEVVRFAGSSGGLHEYETVKKETGERVVARAKVVRIEGVMEGTKVEKEGEYKDKDGKIKDNEDNEDNEKKG